MCDTNMPVWPKSPGTSKLSWNKTAISSMKRETKTQILINSLRLVNVEGAILNANEGLGRVLDRALVCIAGLVEAGRISGSIIEGARGKLEPDAAGDAKELLGMQSLLEAQLREIIKMSETYSQRLASRMLMDAGVEPGDEVGSAEFFRSVPGSAQRGWN
jgi:hypothetical protein